MGKVNVETKVIIIGAGPAGAGTSFFLTKYDIPHIIIEKETFPRDKVCGDGCSGKTALVINRANPDWLKEILDDSQQFLPSWGIKFVAPNGRALDIPFSTNRTPHTPAPGFTSPRLVLDNFLFNKIPSPFATVYQNATVNHIVVENNLSKVSITCNGTDYTITAPLLVGADGDKSIVRKLLWHQENAPSFAVGLRAYYEGVTNMHPENYIELHFLPEVLPGYLWIFPLPNGIANVGISVASERIRSKKINLREQMLRALKTNPQIAPRFANATLKGKILGCGLPLGRERVSISGNNCLLVGDAASLIDPFSGEGIGNALYSGMLAAAAAKEALDHNDFSAAFLLKSYDDVFYKRIGDELKISATMQRLCKYPWLFNFVVNKAYKSPSLRNTISCMFTDIDLREQLSKPLFYFKVLFNK